MKELLEQGGVRFGSVETTSERQAVETFICFHAMKTQGCLPPPSEGDLIAAWLDGVVVGCTALDFRNGSERFPVEELYEEGALERLFPDGLRRSRIVQGGRWFSSLPRSPVSRGLTCAVRSHVEQRGITLLIGEAKSYVFKRKQEWGWRITWDEHSFPDISRVAPEGRKYYETPPSPHLFCLDLRSVV